MSRPALVLPRHSRLWILARRAALPLLGTAILLAVASGAVLIPLVSPLDPYVQDLFGRLKPPGTLSQSGQVFRLGTDELGRDIVVRMFLGARFSLLISFMAVTGASIFGTCLGLLSGFYGGYLDDGLMRVTDMQLAFPAMLLALAVVAVLGSSIVNVVLVFALTGWPIFARTARAATLSLRETTFIEAARCIGSNDWRILFRHILPNALNPLTVVAAFELAKVIIYEASLGFLGLGVQPPTPTLGNMMASGRSYLDSAWWLTFFPGLLVVLTAAAANWTGDGLNELLDPRSRRL